MSIKGGAQYGRQCGLSADCMEVEQLTQDSWSSAVGQRQREMVEQAAGRRRTTTLGNRGSDTQASQADPCYAAASHICGVTAAR